jgi:hypothetical protein
MVRDTARNHPFPAFRISQDETSVELHVSDAGNSRTGLCAELSARHDPLQYEDVACFYANSPHYGVVEKLLMYGVFGGTPRYHALVDPSRPPAEEIVTLLMQPRAILENEVRFLLGSEQIRDPAPYNAILAAIAGGETKFNGIQQLIGVERGALSKPLRSLLETGLDSTRIAF